MADHPKSHNSDHDEKKESFIDRVRKLITADPSDKTGTGVGGKRRQRTIDEVVDEAVKGADEDNGVKR